MSFVHNGLFDIQPAEGFSIFGSGVTEYQNRNCDAVLTQLDSFAQRRNREQSSCLLRFISRMKG